MANDQGTQISVQDALDAIDAKLKRAGTMLELCNDKGYPTDKINACITRLNKMRTQAMDDAYADAINDPEFAKAVAAVNAAAADPKKVATNMTDVTNFVTDLASFFSAAGKVLPAAKGLSG